MRNRTGIAGVVLLALLCAGCATNFTPELVRQEIVTQRGVDPLSAFELNLGRFTTLLIKSALAGEDGELPFAGLSSLQLAVYEAPSDSGPALDVTRFSFTGWDQVLRVHDQDRSGMVLVQPRSDSIGDLVVVGAGARKVVYARLTGRLSRDLPAALGDVLRDGGPDEVQRLLSQLGE
ncbi:MAG: hypothetical protein MPN21_03160 [Thermoanaerobaculia bacterium]|nr:hypothetical protein [Thermoanaerobaculia bacterium]